MSGFFTTMAKRRGATALRTLAVVGLATSLAGCYTQRVAQKEAYPDDYHQRHPITLKEGEQTVEIFVGRNRGGLTPNQRADVLSFAQMWRREATSGIIVDVPQGRLIGRAAAESLHEVQSIFAASGVPGNAVRVRPYKASSFTLASIKINYAKVVATAGPCGLWPHDLGPAGGASYNENREYWNFGCAHQRNLAAMVDNPADLVQPRGETPAYTARRSVAIDHYRKGEDPSGKYSGYDAGKITEIGK